MTERVIIRYMILAAVFASAAISAAAQRLVIDPKTIAQVSANTASVAAIESQHNARVDSIEAQKAKTAGYAASIELIKEMYILSKSNISGFGSESKYYLEIGQCAIEITTLIPRVLSTLYSAKLPNQLVCVKEVTNLELKTQQLVKDFVNICSNGKVQNPLKKGETSKGDGYNMLDRNQRLYVANKIYTDLSLIRNKLQRLMMVAQYATWDDAVRTYAPKDWANLVATRSYTESIIRKWKGL